MDFPSVNETMSPQVFYILLALTDKTLHGYGIRDQVAHDSRGAVVMATGTVYTLLKRLVVKKLVERVTVSDDRPKIACRYELTELGKMRLQAEVGRLETVTQHARYKLAAQKGFLL